MILAALNSRVGTLIPPDSAASSATSTITNSLDINITTAEYTEQYAYTLETTIKTSNRYLSNDPDEARIMIGSALALVAGLVHLAMAILHFGYVTVYLSDSIVQGFTTGCSIHIITSQIPTLLGIKIPTVTGQSKVIKVKLKQKLFSRITNFNYLPKNWIEIFKNIKYSNPATCICSAISIALFAGVRDQINERFKGRMPIPIPIELIIVSYHSIEMQIFKFNYTA